MLQNKLKKLLWTGLIVVWLSHLIGVFTPEVGFDAVWYHLPVAKAIIKAGRLVYLPELYQSVNPLISDLIFTVGYFLGGELGVKVVAYFFGLSLSVSLYQLARQFLSKKWALWVCLVVSTFQVVAWQSSSFYVDVAKASWEVWSLYFLLRWGRTTGVSRTKNLLFSAIFFGFSLGTKLFSLLLWPWWLGIVWWRRNQKLQAWLECLLFGLVSVLPPLPFYWFAWRTTGHPFYSLVVHLKQLGRIGAGVSLWAHLGQRSLVLYQLPVRLLLARDYASLILIVFLPFLIKFRHRIWRQKEKRILLLFTIWQVIIWWYLPPLSTRYALSGFVVWALLSVQVVAWQVKDKPDYYLPLLITLTMSFLVSFAPRFYVNYRSWRYLSGQQTKKQYLQQFLDGNIDQPLKAWHQVF